MLLPVQSQVPAYQQPCVALRRLPRSSVHAGKEQVNEATRGGKGGGLYFPLTAVQARGSRCLSRRASACAHRYTSWFRVIRVG